MDQLKIGKFIAECRKEKKLTQLQLAEMLGITDKAISKWERGIALPDSSIMLDVCRILGISVNELLSGEKINMEEQTQKTEELLLDMTRKEEKSRKKLFVFAWQATAIICTLHTLVGILAIIVSKNFPIASSIVLAISTSVIMIGAIIVSKIELSVGPFMCTGCQHEFTPKFRQALFPIGTPRNYKIRVKCPKCGKKAWAKKILPK